MFFLIKFCCVCVNLCVFLLRCLYFYGDIGCFFCRVVGIVGERLWRYVVDVMWWGIVVCFVSIKIGRIIIMFVDSKFRLLVKIIFKEEVFSLWVFLRILILLVLLLLEWLCLFCYLILFYFLVIMLWKFFLCRIN